MGGMIVFFYLVRTFLVYICFLKVIIIYVFFIVKCFIVWMINFMVIEVMKNYDRFFSGIMIRCG